jgi:hypothetical protein
MTWRLLRPIWRLDNVTASQRLVLLALASFTDQRGANAYPSQGTLARMACCSTRTVRRALADLIAMTIITPHGKGRRGTIRYTVNANVLPTQDTHGHSPRTPTSYNPIKVIPSKSNPSEEEETTPTRPWRAKKPSPALALALAQSRRGVGAGAIEGRARAAHVRPGLIGRRRNNM